MVAYYNDSDPFCCAWLRNLVAGGFIPDGVVDERDIRDVEPGDLRGFAQCHFFAGIGGWPYALQLAGWPADRPVWTGSCPCQPFSSAGRQGGATDERHLWPRWLRLIRECRPDAILGEQVEGAVGFGWVDRVFADLEAENFTCGAAVLGAHSVGAPHIRQRLFWVAQSSGMGRDARPGDEHQGDEPESRAAFAHNGSAAGGVAQSSGTGVGDHARSLGDEGRRAVDAGAAGIRQGNGADVRDGSGAAGGDGGLADTQRDDRGPDLKERRPQGRALDFWADAVWLPCLDGKARRVVAALQPLAHAGECICGLRLGELCACGEKRPSRVGMLRGSGNAIVAATASEFIKAFMEVRP